MARAEKILVHALDVISLLLHGCKMSEGGVTTKRFISPGIGILQSLQGILELVIRGTALVKIIYR